MHLIRAKERVGSLRALAMNSVFLLVDDASMEQEDHIETVRRYLDDLPATARLELAAEFAKMLDPYHWNTHIDCEYLPTAVAYRHYALWRAACFLPYDSRAPIILHLAAFERKHCGARALRFLSEEFEDEGIENTCLTFHFAYSKEKSPTNLSVKRHFEKLLLRCQNLTEIVLIHAGDRCLSMVGELCNRLRKLTLNDLSVTDEGFISFASSQCKKNPCLKELHLRMTRISLRGLCKIWQLPLSIETLCCLGSNFDLRDADADADIDSLLQCFNGPTKLTDIVVQWDADTVIVKKVLERWDALFPSLERMLWEEPDEDMLTSGKIWRTVEAVNQPEDCQIDLPQLATSFPKLISVDLRKVAPLNVGRPLKSGCFRFLHRFNFISREGGLPFDTLSSIVAEARNIRAITVGVTPDVKEQYCDESFCRLFAQLRHLENLRWLVLVVPTVPYECYAASSEEIPLTATSLSCVLRTCKHIGMLGCLGHWSVEREVVSNLTKGGRYDLTAHPKKYMMNYYDASHPFTRYKTNSSRLLSL